MLQNSIFTQTAAASENKLQLLQHLKNNARVIKLFELNQPLF